MKSNENGKLERHRDRDELVRREGIAQFVAFYDFAFPRVYRFAKRRMNNEPEAQLLCRLVLVRALTSLGGLGTSEIESDVASGGRFENGRYRDPAELAFWLYCLARKVADQVAGRPELLRELCAREGEREGERAGEGDGALGGLHPAEDNSRTEWKRVVRVRPAPKSAAKPS